MKPLLISRLLGVYGNPIRFCYDRNRQLCDGCQNLNLFFSLSLSVVINVIRWDPTPPQSPPVPISSVLFRSSTFSRSHQVVSRPRGWVGSFYASLFMHPYLSDSWKEVGPKWERQPCKCTVRICESIYLKYLCMSVFSPFENIGVYVKII